MPPTPSPPTARALDAVELLAGRRGKGLSLSDIARELNQTVSTTQAILSTMCERGWASRDPEDKAYALGPALAMTAALVAAARPLAEATHRAAHDLAVELGYATSVSERAGSHLVFTLFGDADTEGCVVGSGDRIPFTAPFGPAFAAWETEEVRSRWSEQGAQGPAGLTERINEVVLATRKRGYSIERMSPRLMEAINVVNALHGDVAARSLSGIVDQLLVELTTLGYPTELNDPASRTMPVTTLAAPVLDDRGRVALNIAIHPFRVMSTRRIDVVGRRLLRAARELSH